MDLHGKRVAVLAENFYEDLELWYPVLRLREAGADVEIVAPEAGKTYTSKHGYPAQSELAAASATGSEFDAVIVPGGYAPDHMRRHKSMVDLVRVAAQSGKVVAAICHAGWMLASANVIRGKTITCVPAIKDDMVNAGATVVDREVVRDGNIVTSRTPMDLPAFCRTIIEAMAEAPVRA